MFSSRLRFLFYVCVCGGIFNHFFMLCSISWPVSIFFLPRNMFTSLPCSWFSPCVTSWPWLRASQFLSLLPACLSPYISSTRCRMKAESSVFCLLCCPESLGRGRVEKEGWGRELSSLGTQLSITCRAAQRKAVLLPPRYMQFREEGPMSRSLYSKYHDIERGTLLGHREQISSTSSVKTTKYRSKDLHP